MLTLADTITPDVRDAWILEIRHWVAAYLRLPVDATERLLRVATLNELSRIHLCYLYPVQDRAQIIKQVIQPLYSRLSPA